MNTTRKTVTQRALKPLVLSLTALMVMSCGPTYTTQYNLIAAPTKEGQLCSANVELMTNTCIANCRQMSRSCRSGGFNTSVGFGSGRYHGGGWGYNQSILDDRDCSTVQCEDNCMTSARQAHVNCGGTVKEEVVCTSNCPEPVK